MARGQSEQRLNRPVATGVETERLQQPALFEEGLGIWGNFFLTMAHIWEKVDMWMRGLTVSLPACGVALCESSGARSRDLDELEKHLTLPGRIPLHREPHLCANPDEVQDFIRSAHLTSLVLAGVCEPASLASLARAAESAGVPKFAIQTVRLAVYGKGEGDSTAQTWALAVATHVARAEAASFAPLAKKVTSLSNGVDRRGFLSSFMGGLAEAVEDPVLVSDRCAPFHGACRHCSDACRFSAVNHAGPVAEIVHEKCVQCGACSAICPTGALQLPSFSDDEYLAVLGEFAKRSSHFTNPLLVLTCERGVEELEEEARFGKGLAEGAVVMKVPCAAALGWHHYVWAAAANVPVLSVCPGRECIYRPEVPLAEAAARAASDSLEGGNKTLVTHRTLQDTESISDACLEASSQAVRRPSDGYVATGPRRDTILSLPPSLFCASTVHSPSLATFDVLVNSRCVMCAKCSSACPVKALRSEPGASGLELRFFPGLCTGCGICWLECPEAAISISKAFSPEWLRAEEHIVKAKDSIARCRKCNREIGPSLNLKKVYDTLSERGSKQSAETVYLCVECKRKPSNSW